MFSLTQLFHRHFRRLDIHPPGLLTYRGLQIPVTVLVAAGVMTPFAGVAQDATSLTHKITVGAYYGKGDYGAEEDTEILYIPFTYEIAKFPWVVSVTVPRLGLDGPGDVFLEAGNIGRSQDGSGESISESGLGDVIVSGTYQFPPLFEGNAFLDFTLEIKAPTADESRQLGTGKTDVSYQFDIYKTLERTTVFSTLGYRHRGKTSLYDLKSGAYFSLGAVSQLNPSFSLGLLYDYREPASVNSFEIHEVMPFLTWNAGQRWSLMTYTVFGFTDSSADNTVGLQLSFSW